MIDLFHLESFVNIFSKILIYRDNIEEPLQIN